MSNPPDRLDELAARLSRIEVFLARQGFAVEPTAEASGTPSAAPPEAPATSVPPTLVDLAREIAARRQDERTPSAEAVYGERGSVIERAAAAEPFEVTGAVEFAQPIDDAPPAASPGIPSEPPPLPPPIVARPAAAPASPAPLSSGAGNLEQAIGLKLAGWIGAIVLVIGGALGVKFAYDQGWLGGLPNQVKLGLLYACGLALIAAGEFIHRRVTPLAAVGLYGAGVAMLFVVSYAGNAYYQLFEQHTAFGLMAGACAIGFAIALRGRLVSIAVLSLLGANLAPFVLRRADASEWSLLVYVLVLQVLAVSLAHVGSERRWWVLRTLSLATTSFWVLGRLADEGTAHSVVTITFAVVYAGIFQLENAWSAWRAVPTGREPDDRWSPATFSMAVTGALTGAVLVWSAPWSDAQRSILLAGMAALAVLLGAVGRWLRPSAPAARQLVDGAFVQAGTLLFIAAPVALAGPWLVLGWVGLALGYAILGFLIRRPLTALGGCAVWIVAATYLALRSVDDSQSGALHEIVAAPAGVALSAWLVIAIVVQLVGHAIALLVGARPLVTREDRLARWCESAAGGVAIAASIGGAIALVAGLPALVATAALLVNGWLLFALGTFVNGAIYGPLAGAMVVAATAKWLVVDLLGERVSRTWSPGDRALLFNSVMAVGVAAVASLLAITRLTERSRASLGTGARAREHVGVALFGVLCLTVGLSIEVERAVAALGASAWPRAQFVAMGQSVLWIAAALVMVPVCRLLRASAEDLRSARASAATLAVLIAAKFLLVDALRYAGLDRSGEPMPAAVLNAQTLAAMLIVASLLVAARWNRGLPIGSTARGMAALVPVVIGSIELHRLVGPERTLVALSAFWGVYAIGSIASGFAIPSRALRIGGLVLLAITLVKIVLFDLADAGTGWRILSFLGVGGVLLATSVLYGKLSPSGAGSRGPRV
jgi:uncharacterized membrane protein